MAAPDNAAPQSLADQLRQARELLRAGHPELAVPIYQRLAQAFPRNAALLADTAVALYQAGRFQEAAGSAEAALRVEPGLFPALLFLGASRLELGQPAAAVDPLQQAAARRPEDRNARLMLGDALLGAGKAGKAVGEYEQAARSDPPPPRAWYGLARAYRQLADEAFRRVSVEAPGSPYDLALAAGVERERGQLAQAFQLYRRALAGNADLPGVRPAIAAIYEATGHAGWARAERARAGRQPPPDCAAHPLACDFLAGRYAEVAASPGTTPEANFWRARAYRRLAEGAEAKLASLPPSPESAEAAAEREERRGAYREAAARWRSALEAAPRSIRIRRQLAWALYRANDPAALPLFEELIQRDPQSAELNFGCGAALLGQQEVDRALPLLERAVRLDPGLLPAQAALGQAYAQAGRFAEAIPHLQAALAEDVDGSLHYQLARALRAAGRGAEAAEATREADQIRERLDRRTREAAITPP